MAILTFVRNGSEANGSQFLLEFVALSAGQNLMLTIKGELGQHEMIKFWDLPTLSGMTVQAGFTLELFGMYIIMAIVTSGASILILSYSKIAFMTGRAIQILMLPG